eukprot:5035184-Alexandrium_andersonii.AAC.1
MTSLAVAHLVCTKGAVIKIDHLAERSGFVAAKPARGERQGDLQSRGAPGTALGERHRMDRIGVKHAFQREVALLP